MTVAVRALATKDLGSHNARRVVLREVLVGLVNGIHSRAPAGRDRRHLVRQLAIGRRDRCRR